MRVGARLSGSTPAAERTRPPDRRATKPTAVVGIVVVVEVRARWRLQASLTTCTVAGRRSSAVIARRTAAKRWQSVGWTTSDGVRQTHRRTDKTAAGEVSRFADRSTRRLFIFSVDYVNKHLIIKIKIIIISN